MSSRNRPRQSHVKEELSDENHLWNTIVEEIRRCNDIHKKYNEVEKKIQSLEGSLQDDSTDLAKIDELEKLHREGLRLAEEESKILNEQPSNLIGEVETLIFLRDNFEAENAKAIATAKGGRNHKRRMDTEGTTDSPGPSPEVATSASRLIGKSSSRSGSVPVITKQEADQAESKGGAAEKGVKFTIGIEVFIKNRKQTDEGEGILCHITNVTGEGKQRRYEVQDSEPDETGHLPPPYRVSVQQLIAIPQSSATLADLPKGKQVLALYPATTTFYKAEVVGVKKDYCRLRFEGEDEKDKEQDVERRYVLDEPGGK